MDEKRLLSWKKQITVVIRLNKKGHRVIVLYIHQIKKTFNPEVRIKSYITI